MLDFSQVVKAVLFDRDDFVALVDKYGVDDVREELLELESSLESQLLTSPYRADEAWVRRTKSLLTMVRRRLGFLSGKLKAELNGWMDIVRDLIGLLDDDGVELDSSWVTPYGKPLMDWYSDNEKGGK